MLVIGVVLRFVTRSELWLDEALTVNIAHVPIGDLLDALRRDGSPPLFYVLLHGWIDLFGTGDMAVRALSGVIGLAALPAAWYAGRRVGGRAVAWASLLLLAASPFAIRYSTEARPYELQILLVLLGYLALRRALDRPTLGRLLTVAAVTAALLYNSYWSFYPLALVALYLAVRAVRDPQPRAARRALAAWFAGTLAFVPWLPIFFFQVEHTGTPWATPVSPTTALHRAFVEFGGGFHPEGWALGPGIALLVLLGVFGSAVDARRIELDVRTRPLVRWEAAIGFGALVVGIVYAFATSGAFEARYASVVFPLLLLVAAVGVMTFAGPRVRAAVLAVVIVVGFLGGLRNVFQHRTQAVDVAAAINGQAVPGDVVGFCPDQLGPAVDRIVRDDVVERAWPDGGDPEFVDWRDYAERNAATDPEAYADVLLDAAGEDHTIWLVWAGGYRTFDQRCEAVVTALQGARPQTDQVVIGDDDFFEFANLTEFRVS